MNIDDNEHMWRLVQRGTWSLNSLKILLSYYQFTLPYVTYTQECINVVWFHLVSHHFSSSSWHNHKTGLKASSYIFHMASRERFFKGNEIIHNPCLKTWNLLYCFKKTVQFIILAKNNLIHFILLLYILPFPYIHPLLQLEYLFFLIGNIQAEAFYLMHSPSFHLDV